MTQMIAKHAQFHKIFLSLLPPKPTFSRATSKVVSVAIIFLLMDRSEADLGEPLAKLLPLGLGLLYLGKQESVEATAEVSKTFNEKIRTHCDMTLLSCAYAGTGNVLKVCCQIGTHLLWRTPFSGFLFWVSFKIATRQNWYSPARKPPNSSILLWMQPFETHGPNSHAICWLGCMDTDTDTDADTRVRQLKNIGHKIWW